MVESEAGAAPAGVAVAPPPAWAGFRTLTVTDVVAESASVTSFRFAGDDALPAYLPGQFLTVRVPSAGDPVPVRSYSLSGDPDGGRYRISVKREPHGLVSSHLHAHLRRGDRIEVAAPRGDFVLDEGSEPVLLISAGIGQTPLLAMLHRLASEHSGRAVWWIHTTHDADSHAFSTEVADLLAPTAVGALPRLLHDSGAAARAGLGRPGGTTHRGGDRRPGPPGRRERVRLRPGAVHGRRHGRPGRSRHRPCPHPHRAVRVAVADQPRRRRRQTRRGRISRPARRAPARR